LRATRTKIAIIALAAVAAAGVTSSLAQQGPRRPAFRATHYQVTAHLTPATHLITARARVDFLAGTASGTLEFELHPSLKINAVRDAEGRTLGFERDSETPLRVRTTLAAAIQPGEKATLTVDYAGALTGEQEDAKRPSPLASISESGAFLLLPARWFPLTGYPAGRYTATFEMVVPETMAVAGTGKSEPPAIYAEPPPPAPAAAAPPPTKAPAKAKAIPAAPVTPAVQPIPPLAVPAPAGDTKRIVYLFRTEQPEAAGSFVAGNLQLAPVRSGGLTVSIYTQATEAAKAGEYGEAAARILEFFSDEFGGLTQRSLTIVQMPENAPAAFTAPGMAFINRRQWLSKPNERLLARLAAAQWWEFGASPATSADVWLSDGLSRYSEAVFLTKPGGEDGAANRALEEFAVGALAYEDAAPIAQAWRVEPFTKEYRSVVVNKGALVFHMLRSQLGAEPFRALLREYYAKFSGKTAQLEDFQRMAMDAMKKAAGSTAGPGAADATPAKPAPSLTAFFTQWLNSTGVPEFKLEYTVLRTQKGFKTIGKVKQDLETFRMPVEVKIETLGNPEFKTIDVVGTESAFIVESFGRPKPGGISLDPNNHLLKSSPQLRVRTAIARGEEMAELGLYLEATQQYQGALEVQKNNSLAHFRLGEAAFYQKNYQSAANAFRDALVGDLALSYKWVEVWSHIYLGKIFDLGGQRERAIREYSKVKELADDTGGAQSEADKYLANPYQETPGRQ